MALFASSSPASLSAAGNGGSGGADGPLLPPGPPFGNSTTCGDKILGPNEECDDGDAGSDACTATCQTKDEPAAPQNQTDRYQGWGRHPISGRGTGFISTFVEFPEEEGDPIGSEPRVGATLFDIWGKPAKHVDVGAGAFPIDEANPVAAALSNGKYAVAWSNFDGDGADLGIALRLLAADGTAGPVSSANASGEFSQRNPDIIAFGTQVVVAWEDYSDAANGPDLRYRIFDENLNPTSGDLTLAASERPEAAVALAPFGNGFAAAYRETYADANAFGIGKEDVVVVAASKTFRIGKFLGGPPEDRPALVGLDATHLLVVFSAGTDPLASGVFNVPRLRYAIIDTTSDAPVVSEWLTPLDDVYVTDNKVSQLSPAIAWGGDGAYLTWRSEGRPGDAAGDQIWLKYIGWRGSPAALLDLTEREVLVPRVCEGSFGDQRQPSIAAVALPPDNALAIAWDDYSHSQGAGAGDPDVVVQYAPLHARTATTARLVTETWTGADGADWPAQWTNAPTSTTSAIPPVSISGNQGRVYYQAGSGSNIGYINTHSALDVEMVTRVRFNLNSAIGGFIARYKPDPTQPSYILGRVGTLINDTWRIYAVVNGTTINIVNGMSTSLNTPGALFTNYAQQLDYFMRFRVNNTPDNTGIEVGMKLWLTDLPEPAEWTMHQTTFDPTIVAALGATPGRFGLMASENQAGRSTTFDDFQATFYEGATHGLFPATAPSAPLRRAPADYRECRDEPGAKCTLAQACCDASNECGAGLSCQRAQNEIFGLGSHAKTCSVDHCGDRKRNADEPRVDCGGADCAPCTCTSGIAQGAVGYCTTTCPCGIGEGHCNASNQCLAGTTCQPFGLKYGWSATTNACSPFHCQNRVQDVEQGETDVDCGGECGACYFGATSGSTWHCKVWHKCPHGEGTCNYNDECQAGTVCSSTSYGPRYGLPAGTSACVIPQCNNNVKDANETAKDCGGPCGACP